jgi:hypothetical protein
MDNRCFGDVCKSLETQTPEKAAECVIGRTAKDDEVDGCKLNRFFSYSGSKANKRVCQ